MAKDMSLRAKRVATYTVIARSEQSERRGNLCFGLPQCSGLLRFFQSLAMTVYVQHAPYIVIARNERSE